MASTMMSGSLAAPRAAGMQLGSSRSAFRGRVVALAPRVLGRSLRQRSNTLRVQAYEYPYWPDPDYIEDVRASFPDKMVATPDEARVLIGIGYTYLDVRPAVECDEVGKWKQAVNIPLYNSRKVWNAAEQKKEYVKEENPDFIKMVMRKFPDLDTPLLVGCSDGTAYSMEALELLDEAGYWNLVGLKGGFYAWFRVYDHNLRRRRGDGYTEEYGHDGDSCGIHGTGAGFERMDKIEAWVPPKY